MASKHVYENAAAFVEEGDDEGSFVVLAKDDERELMFIAPDEHGPDLAKARAIDYADMMSTGVVLPSSTVADEPAPKPRRKAAAEHPAATEHPAITQP